jgi:DNA polymerase
VILGIDIETHSQRSIRVGSEVYASDSTTGVHCVALTMAESMTSWVKHVWLPGDPCPFLWHRYEGLVLAHNCTFERSILRHVLGPRHGWPLPPIERWRDTQANAAALSLPTSLEGLGAALGAKFQKDMDGHRLMLRCAKRANLTAGERADLVRYCERDVDTMLDCWFRMPPLSPEELEVWFADREINERGLPVDISQLYSIAKLRDRRGRALKSEAVAVSDLLTLRSNAGLARFLGNNLVTVPERTVLRKGCRVRAKTLDVAAVHELLLQPLPKKVRRVLEVRAELGKLNSLAKLDAFEKSTAEGMVHNALRYCAAHTGRWGGYGAQPHNLPKPREENWPETRARLQLALDAGDLEAFAEVWPNVLEGLSLMLRSVVAAPPGFELLGADYSAIEAVGIAWLAGQDDVLAAFAEGRDVYTEDAAKLGSTSRKLGKVSRLSLGYGMGAVLFHEKLLEAGLDVSPKEALRLHRLWRKNNPAVLEFWADVEDAMRQLTTKRAGEKQIGRLRMTVDEECIYVHLPSGRQLHYWQPHIRLAKREIKVIEDSGAVVEKEMEMEELRFFREAKDRNSMDWESTYGGKLSENFTQATTRDLLAAALVRLRPSPYPVVLHVHDSIIAMVKKGAGSVDEFAQIMCTRPAWAQGFPVNAKGYRGRRFEG